MKRAPLVSVIIPVYNGEDYLAESIESVLAQRHRPIEIIVVDDGSTDGTAEVALSFGEVVRYAYQPNAGPASARNRGLGMARGEVVGFLDADDTWVEGKLELQLRHLEANPSVQVVIGAVQTVELAGPPDGGRELEEPSEPMVIFGVGSALFRRPVFDTVGLFDETFRYCEDWDWLMRARELSVPILVHRDVMMLYRRHEKNMTNQVKPLKDHFFKLLKSSLDRRRQGPHPDLPMPKLADFEKNPDP